MKLASLLPTQRGLKTEVRCDPPTLKDAKDLNKFLDRFFDNKSIIISYYFFSIM